MIFAIVGGVFFASIVYPRTRRLWKGFFSLFISGIEDRNPSALMEAARQEFRSKMAMQNNALAKVAGIGERLKMQVASKQNKVTALNTRIEANASAGNMETAGKLAMELQEVEQDLEHDQVELKDTEDAYQANLRQAKLVQKEFEDKVRALEKKVSMTQIKEAQAEAGAALSQASFSTADLGSTLKTVDESLDKRFEHASGKARLVKDLVNMDNVQQKEGEIKALESDALAKFLARKNKVATPTAFVETAKEMGPTVTA